MKYSSFAGKTLILIISNIITGTLAFIFSIILSRKIGSEGMGLYQLILPVYSLFLCITGGGITVTISKIAAEKKISGNFNELYRTIKVTLFFEIIWSTLITSAIVVLCSTISKYFLNDERTVYGILAFCPALIIISISSIYKGAYYGVQRVLEPALIDIIEKIIRITMMCIFLNYLKNLSLELKTAAAILSLSCGEFVSLILFVLCFKIYSKNNLSYGKCDNDFQLLFNVLRLSFPLALNGILGTVFTSIIAVLIPKRLQAAGFLYEEALSLFGKLEGMALTIIFYPSIVINSLCVLLVPSISEAVAFNKEKWVTRKMNLSLKITSLIAFSSAAIFLAIPFNIANYFYNDETVGELIKMLSLGLPLVYIEITLCALLNGMGKQGSLLLNSILISIFELVTLYIFIGIPNINIKGYAIDFFCYPILGILLNMREIKKSYEYYFDFIGIIVMPFLYSLLLYFIIKIILIKIQYTPLLILISYIIFGAIYLISNKFIYKY